MDKKKLYNKEFKARKNKLINFIKKDYNEYNGEQAFLKVNKLLLENYLEFYTNGNNVWSDDKCRAKIIAELKHALVILKRLEEDQYDAEAGTWAKAHCKFAILAKNKDSVDKKVVYKDKYDPELNIFEKDYTNEIKKFECEHANESFIYIYTSEWDTQENHEVWLDLLTKAEKKRQADFKLLFKYIAEHCRGWID